MVEKINTDFEANRKIFWSFVGRNTRCISALKSEAGASMKSVKGKLDILRKHYQKLGVDSNFDDWKQLVENKIDDYSRILGFVWG